MSGRRKWSKSRNFFWGDGRSLGYIGIRSMIRSKPDETHARAPGGRLVRRSSAVDNDCVRRTGCRRRSRGTGCSWRRGRVCDDGTNSGSDPRLPVCRRFRISRHRCRRGWRILRPLKRRSRPRSRPAGLPMQITQPGYLGVTRRDEGWQADGPSGIAGFPGVARGVGGERCRGEYRRTCAIRGR